MTEPREELIEAGYYFGAPTAAAAWIDAQVCNEATCAECGHEGLRYEPYHKDDSYRAFSVCPECGLTEEF